jgi:large subunit ribosomal protein L31
MKDSIHPQFFPDAKVTCSCGNAFTTGSTVAVLYTEVCSQCHPFYTGKQKLLDAAGTVDRFKKRTATAAHLKSTVKVKKERKVRTKK